MMRLGVCVTWIHAWMMNSYLKLNDDETWIIRLGIHQQLDKILAQLLSLLNVTVTAKIVNYRSILLSVADHIAALSPSWFLLAASAEVDQMASVIRKAQEHLLMLLYINYI